MYTECYIEATRIFKKCCQTLGVSIYNIKQNRLAKNVAIIVADEIIRSYPCGCEYDDAEVERKKSYYIDVKYELMKL